MAGEIIRLGDSTTHGGKVIEGSQVDICMGKPIAYLGHKVVCPLCKGTFPIVEGAKATTFYGKGVALAGMKTSCGAALIPSQFTDTVEQASGAAGGKQAAAGGGAKPGAASGAGAGQAGAASAGAGTADEASESSAATVESLLEERTWIGFSLSDGTNPRAGEKYVMEDASGATHEGCLDANGEARLEGIPRGRCKIAFPDIGQSMEMTS